MTERIARIDQKIRQIWNIYGTLSDTDFGKSFSGEPGICSVVRLSGFAMYVVTKPKMKAPKPKPPTISPETRPLLFGNHSQPH